MPTKDPEKRKEQSRRYYERNKQRIKERNAKWAKENRERMNELARKHYHSGGKKYQQKYREENRDKYRQAHSKWYKGLKEKYNIPDRKYGVSQKMLTEILREITGLEVLEEHRFEWCKTSKGNYMPVDIYIPALQLIIEYNGKQHYAPVKFGKQTFTSSWKKFLKQKSRDKRKRRLAEENNIKLMEFPYWIRVNETNVRELLEVVQSETAITSS